MSTSDNVTQKVNILSLPTELLALIIDFALQSTSEFQRTRHLSNYATIHPTFAGISQKRLFSITCVTGEWQSSAFAGLVEREARISAAVRELVVRGEAEGSIGHWLSRILERCRRIDEVTIVASEIGTDVSPAIATQISTLRLRSVFLHVVPTCSLFTGITHLTLHNMYLSRTSTFPTLPNLRSLSYHFDNDLDLPSLQTFPLSGLFHTGSHLLDLEIGRWESYTVGLDDLEGAKYGQDGGDKTPGMTLQAFSVLQSLCLLADSSHRAKCYFPLLKTSSLPLKTFKVRSDFGYRDKQQEVEAMALELTAHFSDPQSSLSTLSKLVLPREFHRFSRLEGVEDLAAALKKKHVKVEYTF